MPKATISLYEKTGIFEVKKNIPSKLLPIEALMD